MLSLLIAHIIITACCLWSGLLFYKFFATKTEERPLIYYLLSGLILFTALAQIAVLFVPITIHTKLIIFAILILLSLIKRNRIRFAIPKMPPISLLLFFIIWAIIILINAGPAIMDDTESYHIQSIKWIQEYGSVPGLVNLHERFGFNTSWFSSVALFSFLPTTTGGFTVLNSVISVWFCFWAISTINSYRKENNLQAALSVVIILICAFAIWPLVRGNAATTNYDFITTTIILILLTNIYFSKKISPNIEWIIWPAYLLTVRIINFPVLLLGLIALILFIKQKEYTSIYLSIAFCFLLIIPFVIRNVIIAGYPFYPATNLDLFNVDWKPDPQMTERLLEYIKYYNRVSTTYLEIDQTKALGSNWVPSWFKYLFTYNKVLVLVGTIGILFSFLTSLLKKNKATLLVSEISLVWLAAWFIISPDPRFVYGILLSGVLMLAYQLILFIKIQQLLHLSVDGTIIILIASSSYYLLSKPFKESEYRNWVLPAKLPQPPVKEIPINGITFKIPEVINNNWNPRCYGTDLPCVYKIDPRLKARGNSIGEGFRLEK